MAELSAQIRAILQEIGGNMGTFMERAQGHYPTSDGPGDEEVDEPPAMDQKDSDRVYVGF